MIMIVMKIMINMTTKNDSENYSNLIESLQQSITADNKSNNHSKQHRTYLEIMCQSYSAGTSTKPIQNNGHRWALRTRQPQPELRKYPAHSFQWTHDAPPKMAQRFKIIYTIVPANLMEAIDLECHNSCAHREMDRVKYLNPWNTHLHKCYFEVQITVFACNMHRWRAECDLIWDTFTAVTFPGCLFSFPGWLAPFWIFCPSKKWACFLMDLSILHRLGWSPLISLDHRPCLDDASRRVFGRPFWCRSR